MKRGAIPAEEAIAIAKQIAEALEEAHEHGIVHRDLKPANLKLTPEMGVRLALGAQPRDIAGMILREGAALAVGLASALALSEVLTRLLFETSPRDPLAFAGVSVFVILLALVAAALPALRASRANPAVALCAE